MSLLKKCSRCKDAKPTAEFYRASATPDGFKYECKLCSNISTKKWVSANVDRMKVVSKAWKAANKEKVAASSKKSRLAHSEEHRARNRAWGIANRAKCIEHNKQWVSKNPEKVARAQRNWSLAHPEKRAAISAERRARKLKATPKWANQFIIAEIYDLSKRRTKITGLKWNVDHIIPLQGKLVCGLHVPENMQVILAIENRKKSNKHFENSLKTPPSTPLQETK